MSCRRRSRSASSASAMLIVISPSAWPVMIFGPSCQVESGIREKIEGEPRRIVGLAHERQSEPQQAVHHAVLGSLETLPEQQVGRIAEVRDRAIETGRPRRTAGPPAGTIQLQAPWSALAQ